MDDTEILSLYVSRDEKAISSTAEKYGSYLNTVSFNILRNYEDTEEVVEDTYWAAWNTIPPQMPVVFKHFLARITRNLAFDRLDYRTAKRRNSHMVLLLSELDTCLPDPGADVEAYWERKRTGEILNGFLSTLPREDCGIFLCRYFYCMTIREIGKRCGLPDRAIKYRLSRMRQQLRKELSKEDISV